MNTGAVIMMVFGCTVVWGGLLLSISITLKKEKVGEE
ncbi:methionine/alanine import family NSS transporter small subunit [Fusobacterium mortiferum]|mgnify:FL=1|uniref:Methionine/alanine import family NSS transporter small subunit n=1 Tax=Fusobacterium mortiferum TaxID=850 RepID=A0ABS2G2V7_FUSMR|nr:methionine/alanine import family NSS transporter small subunit [Fusobacterium mortiferum]MBM6690953.1 methionine/alanine import family NSS transporter small subunit [Fusobacterium mortiferum]MBM6821458.1 methionine/alanine import family NSS transporter small subunit [Fusobacterium mortiferum]MBM6875053.1 methionine/alanine import family NSS transporter small subunit [Fusobacterium mortiferum]